jgi:acyl-coenzyme A thioesterase PaaI-like protein
LINEVYVTIEALSTGRVRAMRIWKRSISVEEITAGNDLANDEGQLTCVSRITMAIVEAK